MAFTYQYGANPAIDYIRVMIGDTVDLNHIFEDSEILMFYQIASAPWQAGQFFSGVQGQTLPTPPTNYLRVAAYALNSIAANTSRLSGVTEMLDVKLDLDKTGEAIRSQAKAYLEMDDNSGAFAIAEQVTNGWTFRDRFLNTVQRSLGGVTFA